MCTYHDKEEQIEKFKEWLCKPHTCCRVTQLSTHNKGILITPTPITHTSPPSLHAHLYPPLSGLQSSHKTDTVISAVGSYSGIVYM